MTRTGLARRLAAPADAGEAAACASTRLPKAYCALCCAAGAERRTGDIGSLACRILLTPATLDPPLLRSLLRIVGEVTPGAAVPALLLLLLLEVVVAAMAATDSGLAGMRLAPCELSRMDVLMERRSTGVVLLLLVRPPVRPCGLEEVRSGGGAGPSAADSNGAP